MRNLSFNCSKNVLVTNSFHSNDPFDRGSGLDPRVPFEALSGGEPNLFLWVFGVPKLAKVLEVDAKTVRGVLLGLNEEDDCLGSGLNVTPGEIQSIREAFTFARFVSGRSSRQKAPRKRPSSASLVVTNVNTGEALVWTHIFY
jgi:hypothetical protein